MSTPIQYSLGDLFAVPLKRGGHGIVSPVRWSIAEPLGKRALLVYGFDGVHSRPPTEGVVHALTPLSAVLLAHVLDEDLVRGKYPRIGTISNFQVEQWPNPPFWMPGRLLITTNKRTLNQRNIQSKGFVSDNLLSRFPPAAGIGAASVLETLLDIAIRGPRPESARKWEAKPDWQKAAMAPPYYRVDITNAVLMLWTRTVKKIRNSGIHIVD